MALNLNYKKLHWNIARYLVIMQAYSHNLFPQIILLIISRMLETKYLYIDQKSLMPQYR